MDILPEFPDLESGIKLVRETMLPKIHHRIKNAIVESIKKDLSEGAHIEVSPPSGQQESKDMIKLSIIFTGNIDDIQKSKVRDIMHKYANRSYLVDKLGLKG